MNIRVRDIGEEGLDLEFAEGEQWGEFLPPHGRVEAFLHVEKTGEYIRVSGEVIAVLHVECSRCLDAFDFQVHTEVQSVLVPAALLEERESEELTEEELDLRSYSGEEFTVDDIIAEHLVLALPIKPLCAEGCKGLCPVCGANRNRQSCSCSPAAAHNPFAVLKKLKIEE